MRSDQKILLVEDDEVDVMSIERALKELGVPNEVKVAANGEEALRWLMESGHALPGLILLDINMPVMNGIEFLQHLKKDPERKKIPVVMLTSSREEIDKHQAFTLGVAGYMVKPVDPNKYFSVMKTISVYWKTSELPF
ncbi:MAG: response regulator [Candidatus Omnitrophota bacterium]